MKLTDLLPTQLTYRHIGSPPATPQASTPALLEVVAKVPDKPEDHEEDTKFVKVEQSPKGEGEVIIDATRNHEATEPDREVGVIEQTNIREETVHIENSAENGELSQPPENSSTVANEDQQPAPDAQPSKPSEHGDHTPTSERMNGVPQLPKSESGRFNVSQEPNHHGIPRTHAPVAQEQTSNGIHQPLQPMVSNPGPIPPPGPRPFSTLPSLQDHLLHLASSKEGVDWAIQVNPPDAQPFVTYTHSIILSRSLRLRRLMGRQQSSSYAGNATTLYPARHVLPHAFEAALRFLYSDTVLGKDFFVQPHPGTDIQAVRIHNLDYLMSYWVAGIELGLEPVSMCAERLLAEYINWDILEITYKYAMDLANSPMSSHGKNMTGSDYLVASNSIIKIILQFLANHLDINTFNLDTASLSNVVPPRLPQLDGKRSKHNPALASMVFGSMPSSANMSPSSPQSEMLPTTPAFRDTVASNILLNVDFENLNLFNNMIQAQRVPRSARLITVVVAEREARRKKIFDSRVSNKERVANSAAWEKVGIKEMMKGNILSRERIGFLVSSK